MWCIPTVSCSSDLLLVKEALLPERDRATRCQLRSCQLLLNSYEIAFEKVCSSRMILKVTQGYRNCHYSMGHISFPKWSGVTNNLSRLHRFPDTAIYYVTVTSKSL